MPPMVLGLSVSSRIIGLAALHGHTLVDHKVHLFKERWNPQKPKKVMECIVAFIQEYQVGQIAAILPPVSYTNLETKLLLSKIRTYCRNHKLPIRFYSLKDLHSLHETNRAKKKALMQALCLLYPELSLARKKELSNKKRYYSKLFEAVGVATVHARQLQD